MTDTIELPTLCGLRVLDGRGEYISEHQERSYVLRLDGVAYQFQEDRNDGYRSSLGSVTVVDPDSMTAFVEFSPMVVIIRLHDDRSNHILYGVDERTGLVVFTVGTEDQDDYYPSFVSTWTPEGDATSAYTRGGKPS